jgi:transcriptional regulator with GAF, ATPase, and Fis domain
MAAARFSGHVKGAFTSADRDEPGYFRAADGGVLFLDEVGDLRPAGQGALLRALDNRTVNPVGDSRSHAFDVVVILATNVNLEEKVRAGGMREDFYRRIATSRIDLAPLRDRPWDIAPLLGFYLREWERRAKKKTLGFTAEALRLLVSYRWPGNVRDIKTLCFKLVAHAKPSSRIDTELLLRVYPQLKEASTVAPAADEGAVTAQHLRSATNAFQKDLILRRIEAFEGDALAAGASLGMRNANTFRRYLRKVGLGHIIKTRD